MPKLHFYDTGLVCWLLGPRVRIRQMMGDMATTRPYVICGGDTAQKTPGRHDLPWSALHSENWVTPAL
jgi:hypothetical protein